MKSFPTLCQCIILKKTIFTSACITPYSSFRSTPNRVLFLTYNGHTEHMRKAQAHFLTNRAINRVKGPHYMGGQAIKLFATYWQRVKMKKTNYFLQLNHTFCTLFNLSSQLFSISFQCSIQREHIEANNPRLNKDKNAIASASASSSLFMFIEHRHFVSRSFRSLYRELPPLKQDFFGNTFICKINDR